MKAETHRTPRPVGRPSTFDRDAALTEAMLLFWRHGYESTSVAELTAAMKVKPPKLYAVFGDKKSLFLEAVAKYTSGDVTAEGIIANSPTAEDAARTLLTTAARGFTGDDTPSGCLLATSAISCSIDAEDIRLKLAAIRRRIESLLCAKIEEARKRGDVSRDSDASVLASYIMAVIQGMSTLARDGASQETLLAVAGQTMRSWPS